MAEIRKELAEQIDRCFKEESDIAAFAFVLMGKDGANWSAGWGTSGTNIGPVDLPDMVASRLRSAIIRYGQK